MIDMEDVIRTDYLGRRVLPEGLVRIFLDPRAEGINPAWVVRLLNWPGPRPTTQEGWLFLYLGLRAAESPQLKTADKGADPCAPY